MHFLSDCEAASQNILEKVGQKAALKYGKKGAKSRFFEYWDGFIHDNHSQIEKILIPFKINIDRGLWHP
jgi:hypothetical protein